ncbi:hypothetical protein LCGC14_1666680 [marine sediment metagenome]|uniref:Thymidylate synthase/dCMP hydroxymethylase domain-containing protein n=1 Tax=marine sediment metagenome TaxID=412755 RepID=A0A0F9IF36_9ZZZZ
MKTVNIKATTLSDAWFQAVYKCLEVGRDFTIDRGSYKGDKRLEFDHITIQIQEPWHEPLLPKIPETYNLPDPVEEGYVDEYLPYLMTGEIAEGESYTYGSRLNKAHINNDWIEKEYRENELKEILIQEHEVWKNKNIIGFDEEWDSILSQVELLIWTYKNKGVRNNQMVLQVAQPDDMLLQDPPCLRHIDTRIQDDKLHFFPYFRSWDLWGGFPANLAAIELMKQYIAGEIGVGNGQIIAASKGLHLYSYVWELAEIIRGKTIEEFRKG